MKTLHLLRHGKSSWDDAALDDHDRPLAPRGIKAAARVGRHLRVRGVAPDLALCSTARRAVDTLEIVLDALLPGRDSRTVAVERERGLYLAGAQALLARLHTVPDGVSSVLLVGHNPDLHDLAMALAVEGDESTLRALAVKFPTAACATIRFPAGRWSDLAPGSGRLEEFVIPRTLA